MSFYGNLVNKNRTALQFDKIYPNRHVMDESCATDGVEFGRFVLVEYGTSEASYEELATEILPEKFVEGFIVKRADGTESFRDGPDKDAEVLECEAGTYVKVKGIIIYTLKENHAYNDNNTLEVMSEVKDNVNSKIYNESELIIYYCSANDNFIEVEREDFVESYWGINYNVDKKAYQGVGRHWDSTVWQKTSVGNGESKYIMIADLNTTTPTFDIIYDAPTGTPLVPHLGIESSNNLYKIHMQPSWGMRIKNSTDTATYSSDNNFYPSDVTGPYVVDTYLEDGVVTTEEDIVPLAIYFNKAGFDKYKSADSAEEFQKKANQVLVDNDGNWINSIRMAPTGKSANVYVNHLMNGSAQDQSVNIPDTMELSFMLPSIGQTMSDIWDLVYGKSTYYDNEGSALYHPVTKEYANESKEFKLRNTDVEWNSDKGIRSIGKDGINRENLGTLAGIINSTHDLMGMIVYDFKELGLTGTNKLLPADWDPTKIYYVDGKYYMKYKQYNISSENKINSDQFKEENKYSPVTIINSSDIYRQEVRQYADSKLNSEDKRYYFNYHKYNDDYIDGAIYVRLKNIESQDNITYELDNDKTYYTPISNGYEQYDKINYKSPDSSKTYYLLNNITPIENRFYIPGLYYYTSDNGESYQLATSSTMPAGENYKFYKASSFDKVEKTEELDEYTYKPILDKDGNPVYTLYSEIYSEYNNVIIENNQVKIGDLNNLQFECVHGDNNAKTADVYKYYCEEDGEYYTPLQAKLNDKTIDLSKKEVSYKYVKETYTWVYYKIKEDEIKNDVKLIPWDSTKEYYYRGGEEGHYIYYRETYNSLASTTQGIQRSQSDEIHYYTIEPVKQELKVWNSKDNYYIVDGNDYIRETSNHVFSENTIVQINDNNIEKLTGNEKVWVPNKYYIKINNNYQLASDYVSDVQYYEKIGFYVINDRREGILKNAHLAKGAEYTLDDFNNEIDVGTRTESWEAKELKEFGYGENTLYGMLLKIQRLVAEGDSFTRDNHTLQGAINKLNDTVSTFNTIAPLSFSSITTDDGNSVVATGKAGNIKISGDGTRITTSIINGEVHINYNKPNIKEQFGTLGTKIDLNDSNRTDEENTITASICTVEDGYITKIETLDYPLAKIPPVTIDKNNWDSNKVITDASVNANEITFTQSRVGNLSVPPFAAPDLVSGQSYKKGAIVRYEDKNYELTNTDEEDDSWKDLGTSPVPDSQFWTEVNDITLSARLDNLENSKLNIPKIGYISLNLKSGAWMPGKYYTSGITNSIIPRGEWTTITLSDDISYSFTRIASNDLTDFLSITPSSIIYLQPAPFKKETGLDVFDYASLAEYGEIWQNSNIIDGQNQGINEDDGSHYFDLITLESTDNLPDKWITLRYTIVS